MRQKLADALQFLLEQIHGPRINRPIQSLEKLRNPLGAAGVLQPKTEIAGFRAQQGHAHIGELPRLRIGEELHDRIAASKKLHGILQKSGVEQRATKALAATGSKAASSWKACWLGMSGRHDGKRRPTRAACATHDHATEWPEGSLQRGGADRRDPRRDRTHPASR